MGGDLSTRPRPTALEVARRAQVSQSTVSLVLQGKDAGRVSDVTRRRVLAAASELGYHPNAPAQALRMGRGHILALVVPGITNPFFGGVMLGAERAARAHHYRTVLVNTEEDEPWERELISALTAHAVDGFVLWSVDRRRLSALDGLRGRMVLVESDVTEIPSVHLDVAGGVRAVMRHLLDLGHRRIAHLAASYIDPTFTIRSVEYERCLGSAGLERRPGDVARAGFGLQEATEAAHRLLQQGFPPTAVLCDDDLLAAGVYRAARDRGLDVPRDLAVAGFDDIELAQILDPPLTTVAIPAERVGGEAVDLLVRVLDGAEVGAAHPIPLRLVVRGSTAPPRR